ncbi:MAG: hydroxymethylglutaryl-CoA lyase [Granulosicoccus sp.]|nr:hydroxymethylglutaryl-CoA lyase [Granulosicoccus sp.]
MKLPDKVCLVEVGPRDGLQNEATALSVVQKSTLVDKLSACGLSVIETGSFVSARWVPQMADSGDVFSTIRRYPGVRYTALTPNERGLDAAIDADVSEVAIFAAVTESFSMKNLNASIAATLSRYETVLSRAAAAGLPVRGYLSCVLGCPYEGAVAPEAVRRLTRHLLDAGCHEVSLGDTIGTGTAGSMNHLLDVLLDGGIPVERLAVHCHDTYGQALANILVALQRGVGTIDTSVSGLGGCPFAVGATGNVATEDVVYLLDGLGIEHGVDLDGLLDASRYISEQLGRETQSRAARALFAARGIAGGHSTST